ncbi:hypothetical protein BC834DRAFT_1034276 [Gloeopeniophorella convolvens]|nr:hypothetical protein BC834DRAFT_1034276 [Gloeopeniophorella convolvens]
MVAPAVGTDLSSSGRPTKNDVVKKECLEEDVTVKDEGCEDVKKFVSLTPSSPPSNPRETHPEPTLEGIINVEPSESQTEVEDEISAMALRLASLKARRNDLLPIFRLSVEMLSCILAFLVHQEPPGSQHQRLGWIAVTHVCHRLRQVAIDNPALWGNIAFALGSMWATEMFSRARTAPLDIFLSRTVGLDNLAVLPNYQSHIRTLYLELPPEAREYASQVLITSAPVLESLTLSSHVDRGVMHLGIPSDIIIFQGHAPQLHTISLQGALIPWQSFPRNSLSHLEVKLKASDLASSQATSDSVLSAMMDVLQSSPDLETLVLDFCIPPASSSWTPRHRTIYLPRLKYLSLAGPSLDVYSLLMALDIPSSAKLRLHCISARTGDQDSCLIIPLISSHLHGRRPAVLQSLRLVFPKSVGKKRAFCIISRDTFPASAQDFTKAFFLAPVHPQPELHLTFESSQTHVGDLLQVFSLLFPALPLEELRFLYLEDVTALRSSDWTNCFTRCKKVTAINTTGRHSTDLLKTMAPQISQSPVISTNHVSGTHGGRAGAVQVPPSPTSHSAGRTQASLPMFPQLATLLISRLELGFDEPSILDFSEFSTLIHSLQAWHNPPLQTLRIADCRFHGTPPLMLMQMLANTYSNLQFDGKSLNKIGPAV